ncbi:MAG: hypothetical protein J6K29_03490 [Clostridia bacterium]|nr:hypothetical protein [Clostridia bacterium]
MKNTRLNTQFFNFRLFLEALKRLRVIGLATAILAITASALVPIVYWIEQKSFYAPAPYAMETEFLCVPAGFAVLLAPFFFLVLFSFLQKRKESDFFHAIPYTRTCVYVSFVTAALTFVWVIQAACALTAGILWAVNPMVIADIGGMVAYTLISMLAAAMLSAFMMLALTVSGTGSSCILLFVLFAGFTRVIAAIFLGCLENIDLLPIHELWDHSFLAPQWFLPINVIYYMGNFEEAAALMYSLPNILYSIAVTLAVFALAGLIYKHRRSEMAGNPAPGVKTQALFRIMFTVLLALLIPLLAIQNNAEPGLILVLVVGVLLVYFLYELITTKRPKNMLKAIPGLGIVAGACIAFTILFYAYRGVLLYENIGKEDVKTVSMDSNGLGINTYQSNLLGDLRVDDPEIIGTVVKQLALSQQYEREGYPHRKDTPEDYWQRQTVTIHLKSGRTIERSIVCGEEVRAALNERYMILDVIARVAFLIPEKHEIQSGGIELMDNKLHHSDYEHLEDTAAVMAIFRREFDSLSKEQKREVMMPTLDYYSYNQWEQSQSVTLTLRGRIDGNGETFHSRYLITEAMPETRAYLIGIWGTVRKDNNYFECAGQTYGGSADDAMAAFGKEAQNSEFTEAFPLLKGDVTLMSLGSSNGDGSFVRTVYLSSEDYARLAELIRESNLVHADTTPESFTLTENTYSLALSVHMDDSKYTYLHLSLHTLVDLSPEAYELLKEILPYEY